VATWSITRYALPTSAAHRTSAEPSSKRPDAGGTVVEALRETDVLEADRNDAGLTPSPRVVARAAGNRSGSRELLGAAARARRLADHPATAASRDLLPGRQHVAGAIAFSSRSSTGRSRAAASLSICASAASRSGRAEAINRARGGLFV
jgi:hypothetical protein